MDKKSNSNVSEFFTPLFDEIEKIGIEEYGIMEGLKNFGMVCLYYATKYLPKDLIENVLPEAYKLKEKQFKMDSEEIRKLQSEGKIDTKRARQDIENVLESCGFDEETKNEIKEEFTKNTGIRF